MRLLPLFAFLLLAALPACELIVGEATLPLACEGPLVGVCPGGLYCVEGRCVTEEPTVCGACPIGTQCDEELLECVTLDASFSDARLDITPAPDRTAEDTSEPSQDSPAQEAAPEAGDCRHEGCRCSGPADCDTSVCADALALTNPVYVAAGRVNVCSKACCTSEDCPQGMVCYAPGNGGHYCIPPGWIGRPDPPSGAKPVGSPCAGDQDCRSGLCSMGDGGAKKCIDVCCDTGSCGAGLECSLSSFPGKVDYDRHRTFVCRTPPGSSPAGAICISGDECKSGACFVSCAACPPKCLPPCRSSAQCADGHTCIDATEIGGSGDVFALCGDTQPGAVGLGGQCGEDRECATANCNTVCTDVCFGDADCAGPSDWVCGPSLRSVAGGSVSVLNCQPRN